MKTKSSMVAAVCLSLAIGFAGGFIGKEIVEKQNAHTIAETVPVHKLRNSEPDLLSANQLIAPGVWHVYLDPLWTPLNASAALVDLPKLAGFPADVPKIKTMQTDKEVRVSAKLPGLSDKDVDIQVGKDEIAIKGKKEEETKRGKLFQNVHEAFEQIVQLPCRVDGDKAKATFKNGELTVVLPKDGSNIAQSPKSQWQ
ncbi:MAG TPA: Hsp20/alpha crystallin family protein [Planktothrix sp.]|jgi:HSP20 family molecular chaperone IbpA